MTFLHDRHTHEMKSMFSQSHQMTYDSSDVADNISVSEDNSFRITSGSTSVAD